MKKKKVPTLKKRGEISKSVVRRNESLEDAEKENEKVFKALKKAGLGELANKLHREVNAANDIVKLVMNECTVIHSNGNLGEKIVTILRKYYGN